MSELSQLEEKFSKALSKAKTPEDLESVRREFVGGKGSLDALLKNLKNIPVAERQKTGQDLNSLKERILSAVQKKKSELENAELEKALSQEKQDPTLPSHSFRVGRTHPITRVLNEITEIFLGLGFGIAEGPEIETEENNFEALNIPADHPARDGFDTFYIEAPYLVRSHTSPVQIRTMKARKPPIRVIAPGKVFRPDKPDAGHSPMFHQIEGLLVGPDVTFAHLKGVLDLFVKAMWGERAAVRFRPSYFPFTEPSAEVDVTCFICGAKGCPACKGSGWVEILGSGMVHPRVLAGCGIDPEVNTGFAFGMGVERICMLRHGIPDIRRFTENHFAFLRQF